MIKLEIKLKTFIKLEEVCVISVESFWVSVLTSLVRLFQFNASSSVCGQSNAFHEVFIALPKNPKKTLYMQFLFTSKSSTPSNFFIRDNFF
jgi:hypothetical protein